MKAYKARMERLRRLLAAGLRNHAHHLLRWVLRPWLAHFREAMKVRRQAAIRLQCWTRYIIACRELQRLRAEELERQRKLREALVRRLVPMTRQSLDYLSQAL